LLFAIFVGFVVIAVMVFDRHQFDRGFAIFLWSFSWWFLIIGTVYTLNSLDLLVNDSGLARIVFGKPCQRLAWDEIRMIREYSQTSRADAQIRRYLRIYPRQSSFLKFRLIRTMLISEKIDGFDELINVMNDYITRHSIRIETSADGLWKPRDKLSSFA